MKTRNKTAVYYLILAILGIINLAVLLYLKYYLNGLPVNEFRFDYAGNILNLCLTGFFLIGIVILQFGKKNVDGRRIIFLLSLQILLSISFALIILLAKFNLINPAGSILNFPMKKVYVGILFISGGLISLYSLLFIWGLILGPENLFEIRTLVRTGAIIILFLIFSLFYVWNVTIYDDNKIGNTVYDFGCIPGAAVYSNSKPSPIFEARIRKAFRLYQKGSIKMIILTGGNAPGEISESQAAYKYLRNLDLPIKNLRIETESSTTTLQIKFLYDEYWNSKTVKPIVVISDGFHLTRIIEISKFFNVKVIGVSSEYSMSLDKTIFYRTRESVALLLFWFFAI
ncbi:MAG: YdcF family protein [Melioribacteraceae bacterium]